MAGGIAVGVSTWILYVWPGNGFDLRLNELFDPLILGAATPEDIEATVLLIASRYVLPTAVLVWGIIGGATPAARLSAGATALLPPVAGAGAGIFVLAGTSAIVLPWDQLGRVVVLIGYLATLVVAFGLVGAVKKLGSVRSASG